MSSCLSGGGRTYGFDLDIVKPQSPSIRSSHSSSPSSTLSESSNSTRAISTKRARTPRKRPNQSYTEAAALLSTVHPKVFSSRNLSKLCKHSRSPYDSFVESSELLPPFPAIGDAGFLIHDQSPEKPSFRIETKSVNSHRNVCGSPPSVDFRQPGSPVPLGEDFDADSILDEESGEGIDSIMGNLTMDNNQSIDESASYNVNTSPYFGSLKGFGLGAKFELGFGFGLRGDLQRALRQSSDADWWKSPTVMIRDIIPKFKALPPPSSSSEKKKKKKKKKLDLKEVKASPTTAPNSSQEIPRPLLLKLNFEEVVKEWSDREHPIPDAVGSPESSAEALARLAEIELFPAAAGGGGGVREASVMRYKEKRRSRLFSKKIRYQVRKVNADRRPRMKGRFVRRPELLQEAIEEESK